MTLTTGANQNLIKQVPEVKYERPTGFYRALIFDVLSVGAAGLTSFYFREYLLGTAGWGLLAMSLGIFGIISAIQVYLPKGGMRRYGILLLETAALMTYFVSLPLGVILSAAAAVFIYLSWGEKSADFGIKNSLEIQFLHQASVKVSKIVTGTLLAGIMIYLSLLPADAVLISRTSFDLFYDETASFAANFYKGVNFKGTFIDFAKDLARLQISNNPRFDEITAEQKELAVNEAAKQISQNFFGEELSPAESTSAVFYKFINRSLNGWRNDFGNGFLAV